MRAAITQMDTTAECHTALSDVLSHLNLTPKQQAQALELAAPDACISTIDSGSNSGHASSTDGTNASKGDMVLLLREIDEAELGGRLASAEETTGCPVSLGYQ